jgi:hypothetical protein
VSVAGQILQYVAKAPKPKHTADQMPDGKMGKHIREECPGPGNKYIEIGRQSKPIEYLPLKKLTGGIGNKIYNRNKLQQEKQQHVDGK